MGSIMAMRPSKATHYVSLVLMIFRNDFEERLSLWGAGPPKTNPVFSLVVLKFENDFAEWVALWR